MSLIEVVGQPAFQFLFGVALALIFRLSLLFLLMLAGSLSRRVTQLRLSGLLEEFNLYKFFERRPTVLMARAMERQFWVGTLAVVFCIAWVIRIGPGVSDPVELALSAIGAAISFAIGWVSIDLFRLVRPISEFQRYETSTQDRIARMKARVMAKTQRLRTEQEELEEIEENLKRMSDLAEEGAFEHAPFFSEAPRQEPSPQKSDAPQVEAPATAPASEQPGVVRDTTPHPEAAPASTHARASARQDGSVYQSAWMSGRVKRWPDGAPYGFIVADTGEQFFAGADNLAGLESLDEGEVVLFQPIAGTPHRKASLICGMGSYAQGRVNGLRGNMGFVTIQDSRASASIYFRLPVGILPTFDIGDTVGFRFGRNILGPTAEKIDTDLGDDRGVLRRQR